MSSRVLRAAGLVPARIRSLAALSAVTPLLPPVLTPEVFVVQGVTRRKQRAEHRTCSPRYAVGDRHSPACGVEVQLARGTATQRPCYFKSYKRTTGASTRINVHTKSKVGSSLRARGRVPEA